MEPFLPHLAGLETAFDAPLKKDLALPHDKNILADLERHGELLLDHKTATPRRAVSMRTFRRTSTIFGASLSVGSSTSKALGLPISERHIVNTG